MGSVTQLLRLETTPVSFIYSFQFFDSRKNWKIGKLENKPRRNPGILNFRRSEIIDLNFELNPRTS